jgi:hypothetical protein
MSPRLAPVTCLALLLLPVGSLAAQQADEPAPTGSRITNAGVVRANATVDSVFLRRTHAVDTVDVGDFAAHLLARLGVPPFDDSLAFRVHADSSLVWITGRLRDFPPESRTELGPLFSFIDSLTPFVAEIALTRGDHGVMRFRLRRVTVSGFPIPELLLLPALREYNRRYPVLAQNGRELLIAMPEEAVVRLVPDGVELRMPPREEGEPPAGMDDRR